MIRKLVVGLISALLILVLGTSVLGGQRPPKTLAPPAAGESPHPPQLPEPPEPFAPETAMVLLGDGGAWLGVRLRDVNAEKARELKLPGEYGALVIGVEPDSPAAKAGLEKNEVIVEFGGERVRSVAQLQRLVRETPAGRSVSLRVSRAGEVRPLEVKLEQGWEHFKMPHVQIPEIHLPDFGQNFFFAFGGAALGITGEEMTRQLADYFGVKQGRGVLVREVKEGSPAAKAGLKAGDVIVRVDDTEVGTVSELREALPHELEEARKTNVTIVRDHREQTLSVDLEPSHPERLRRAERFEVPEVDLSQLKQLATQYQQRAGQHMDELRNFQRELSEQSRRWQQEWQREWRQELQLRKRELQQRKHEREDVGDLTNTESAI